MINEKELARRMSIAKEIVNNYPVRVVDGDENTFQISGMGLYITPVYDDEDEFSFGDTRLSPMMEEIEREVGKLGFEVIDYGTFCAVALW